MLAAPLESPIKTHNSCRIIGSPVPLPALGQLPQLLRSGNTSGFRGVSRDRARKAWLAKIRVAGKLRHLGRFPSPEEAAQAWDSAAREAWGPLAYQNFPSAGGGDSRSDDGINSPVNVI